MPIRGEITSKLGRASFDNEFFAANAKVPLGGWMIESLLVLSKYYSRLITPNGLCGCKCI